MPGEMSGMMPGGGMGGMPGGGMPGMMAPQPKPQNLGGATGPQDPKGIIEMARVNMKIAMNLLEQTIPVFGAESEEGRAVMKALGSLSKDFGKGNAEDLTNSQLINLFSTMQRSQGPAGGQIPPELLKAVGNQGGGQPPQPGGGMPGM